MKLLNGGRFNDYERKRMLERGYTERLPRVGKIDETWDMSAVREHN